MRKEGDSGKNPYVLKNKSRKFVSLPCAGRINTF